MSIYNAQKVTENRIEYIFSFYYGTWMIEFRKGVIIVLEQNKELEY